VTPEPLNLAPGTDFMAELVKISDNDECLNLIHIELPHIQREFDVLNRQIRKYAQSVKMDKYFPVRENYCMVYPGKSRLYLLK